MHFSDKVINLSFADKVTSEMLLTRLALYYTLICFAFWLYFQMRPEVAEVISEKELSYAIRCQENTRKLYSKPFFQIILFLADLQCYCCNQSYLGWFIIKCYFL